MGYEGDTCSFTCNTGYELTGSDTRTCQSNGSWSGSNIICMKGNFVIHRLNNFRLNFLLKSPAPHLTILIMELLLVHWEMMEFLPMKTLVVSHVTLVMS